MKIHVLDAAPGSGKTTKLMEMISLLPASKKVIYITPLLSECHRIAGTYPTDIKNGDMSPLMIDSHNHAYDENHILAVKRFNHPMTKRSTNGTKLDDFKSLVENGCNIISTHSLFTLITPEICNLLKENEYILVLDEVLTMYDEYENITKDMLARCIANNWMYIDDDKITLKWNHSIGDYKDIIKLDEIGRLCDNNQLLIVDGNVVILEFPFQILSSFTSVHIATYMFSGSQMYPYLSSYGAEMEIIKFGKLPSEYKHLINIITDPKMNKIGNDKHDLSATSLKNKENTIFLSKAIHKFFRTVTKSKPNDRLWTTNKLHIGAISKGFYTKNWIACNTKATNEYGHTWAVAYLMNLFPNPMIKKLLSYKNASIDEPKYALSELIQFIWRSRIRNNEPIIVYIPSHRMRDLLIRWLDDEFIEA